MKYLFILKRHVYYSFTFPTHLSSFQCLLALNFFSIFVLIFTPINGKALVVVLYFYSNEAILVVTLNLSFEHK